MILMHLLMLGIPFFFIVIIFFYLYFVCLIFLIIIIPMKYIHLILNNMLGMLSNVFNNFDLITFSNYLNHTIC